MLHKESIEFMWESPEFIFKEKTEQWYWYIGIAGFILIILAIVLKNYLFAFLILIAGFLMFKLSTQEPVDLPIEISQHGININKDVFKYQEISAFWITENQAGKSILLFASKRPIAPIISVTIEPHINLMQLREYLLEYIAEQELREPVSDRIINKIGF